MEQRIIDDLILKLHNEFPEIIADDTRMEMQEEPEVFRINCYDRRRTDRITPSGFFYTYYFEIVYFPGNDEPELKIRDVELRLTDAVWLFGTDDIYRGDDIYATTVDGILHLFFSVTVPLERTKPDEPLIKELVTEVNKDDKQVSSQTIKESS